MGWPGPVDKSEGFRRAGRAQGPSIKVVVVAFSGPFPGRGKLEATRHRALLLLEMRKAPLAGRPRTGTSIDDCPKRIESTFGKIASLSPDPPS